MNHQLEVLEDLLAWRVAGYRAVLLTVCSTWPSAPVERGSLCAIREDGRLSGSVSGGRLEAELIDRVRSGAYWSGPTRLLQYTGTRSAAGQHLPAGASLLIALEPAPDPGELRATVQALRARRVVCRELALDTDTVASHITDASARGTVHGDGQYIRNILRPGWRLLTVGGGDIAHAMSRLARFVRFDMVTCPAISAGLPGPDDGRPTAMARYEVIEPAALDPLTVVLLLDAPSAARETELRRAVGRAGAYYCMLVPPGGSRATPSAPRPGSHRFHSSGSTPEEIAISMLSAMIGLRAAHLGSDPASVVTPAIGTDMPSAA